MDIKALASKLAKDLGYDPEDVCELAALLLEEINHHEVASAIRNA